MEENDARIFAYFVVDCAPVEGVVFYFVDLQRTRHFLERKKTCHSCSGFLRFFFPFFAKSAQRKCMRHLFSKFVVDGDALGRVLARVVAYISPAYASQLCILRLVSQSGGEEAVQFKRGLAGCRLDPNLRFSFLSVVHLACNPSIQTRRQCILSVFSNGRRESGRGRRWGSRKRQAASVRKQLLQTREQDGNNRKRGQRLRKIWL